MKLKLILIFLIIIQFSQALSINEIMYNPEGNDNNQEYVEIFHENPMNLEGYFIQDSSSEDELELLYLSNSTYSLIVEEGFNYSNINCSVYSIGATIGNNLNNDEDIIVIKDQNQTILDALHYYNSRGGNGNGMSTCKLEEWKECFPTPGDENSDYTNFSSLMITEFLPDPDGNDDDPMPDGEWVELYNSGENSLDVTGLILNDDYGNGLEISDVNVLNGDTIIEPNSYLTIYKNQDGTLTLNNDGMEIIKLFYENILLDEVSYSSCKESLSWSKFEDDWILTHPTPSEENNRETPDHSSHLEIETVYLGSDDKAEFGDQIRVRLNIYKGDETKYNLDLYIKDGSYQVSKRTEINVYEKFQNYTITAPIQIEPNCNEKYKDGTYTIYLKGLDEVATEEIEIEGIDESLCKTITETITSEKESTQSSYSSENSQFIEDNSITGNVVYESSDIKAKNTGIYFFAGVLIIVVIFLLFKKNL